MKTLASAMPAYLRQSLATMLQYRGEIVLWAVWGVAYPLVAMAAWSEAVKASPSGQDIHGFGPREFAAYFLLTMIAGHVSTAWNVYEMGWLVRTGQMSPQLLRPILPVWQSVADNIAYKTLTLAVLIPTWIAVAWLTEPRFTASGAQLALGAPALLLGAILHFLWGYNVSLIAFWAPRTDALGEMWWGLNLLLGGRLFPVTIMPLALQWAAASLPFKWIIWFPAAALTGRLRTEEIAGGLLWQMAWLVAGIVVFRFGWRAAVRRYSAVGA